MISCLIGSFLPKNMPRRLFSISSTQTSSTITDPCELKMLTSCARPSYQMWVWTKCSRIKKALAASAVLSKPIAIKVVDGKVMINDATVAAADVAASNGVIHVIDTVLLPPSK